MADLKLTADFTDIQTLKRELLDIPKKARDSARTFEAEYARVERALVKQARQFQNNAAESQKYYSQLLKLGGEAKSAERSAEVFTRALEKQEQVAQRVGKVFRDQTSQAVRSLAREFARSGDQSAYLSGVNKIVNAQNMLQAGSRMSRSEIMRLGIEFQRQTKFANQLAIAQGQVAAATQRSNKGLARSGLVMQQTGYQVGDFLVQVQSGTNMFVAFGQQATQLAGLLTMSLNPKIVALGVALSIIIPLTTAVAAYFSRTKKEADSAAGGVETLDDRLKSLDNTLTEYLRTRESLSMGITVEELLGLEGLEQVRNRLRASLKDIRDFIQAQYPGQELPDSFITKLALESEEYKRILGEVIVAENRIATLRQRQGEEQFRNFSERLTQYQEEIKLQQTINQFGENSEEARQVRLEQAIAAEFRRIEALRAAGELTDAQALSLQRSAEEAERLAAVDIESGVAAAASSAAQLAERLGVSVTAASRLMAMGGGREQEVIFDPRDPRYDRNRALMAQVQAETITGPRRETPERTAAGGVDPLAQLQERLRLETELLGKSEAQQRVIQALGINWRSYGEETVNSLVASIEEMDRFNERVQQQQQLADSIANSFGDAFMSIIDGTKSTKDAFKDMARAIIADLYQMFVVKQITGFIGNAIMGAMGGGGPTRPVMRPTGQAAGGYQMPGRPYLVGENGPELVIPGRSGTVKNADLTNKAMGGGDTFVVNQTINVSTCVQQTVRNEIKQLMPQIAESAKSAVVDAKRRGGSYGRAFS